jgi:hypothetical protein
MRPFPPPNLVWPRGETRLHVYAVPDRAGNPALLDLIDRARPVCNEFADSNVLVEEEWLHATVQQIACDARTLGEHQRSLLAGELEQALRSLAPFTLNTAGFCVGTAGVLLDLDGDQIGEPWHMLSARVADAIGRICGPQALSFDPGPPHLSLTYCSRETDSGDLQGRLRRQVRPSRAPFTVREVQLLDVIQNADAHTYTWRHVARIPLGDA